MRWRTGHRPPATCHPGSNGSGWHKCMTVQDSVWCATCFSGHHALVVCGVPCSPTRLVESNFPARRRSRTKKSTAPLSASLCFQEWLGHLDIGRQLGWCVGRRIGVRRSRPSPGSKPTSTTVTAHNSEQDTAELPTWFTTNLVLVHRDTRYVLSPLERTLRSHRPIKASRTDAGCRVVS
ncbi:CYFA0S03e06359g1_1 [Cyberlindnera fabianii]|uniref:CYFA0S03e06359g1_1 n=1 Tax=Cyberlindnera fabianii TaxID=36022 RepID=A0A061AWC8_CYBFA|nr:CYFA0S03e06359g1_1 [Cyberlindnera fabianii]